MKNYHSDSSTSLSGAPFSTQLSISHYSRSQLIFNMSRRKLYFSECLFTNMNDHKFQSKFEKIAEVRNCSPLHTFQFIE